MEGYSVGEEDIISNYPLTHNDKQRDGLHKYATCTKTQSNTSRQEVFSLSSVISKYVFGKWRIVDGSSNIALHSMVLKWQEVSSQHRVKHASYVLRMGIEPSYI